MTNFLCDFYWGRAGAIRASENSEIVVIVDTLSFSTTVAYAVKKGAVIYPLALGDDTSELSEKYNAEIAVSRKEVPDKGRFSLSPFTYDSIEKNTKVVLPALNGGTCCKLAQGKSNTVLIGALVNAQAIADYLMTLSTKSKCLSVSVVACGERFKESNNDGGIRFAIEDYLGAGAIISMLDTCKTPEAKVCEGAFKHNQITLERLIWDCESGVALREIGFGEDVKFASKLNSIEVVPILKGDTIVDKLSE
ncbi:MAG: 2-phosphosulfolactate phosphatase [bacterium]